MGVGTLLRLAADALARTACLGARVKVQVGQQRLLCTANVAGGAGQSCGEGSGAALLAALSLLSLAKGGALQRVETGWWLLWGGVE